MKGKIKKKWFIIAGIVLIAIIAAIIMVNLKSDEEISDEAVVEYMDVFNQLEFSGNIEPNDTRGVYSVVNQAKVSEVLVKNGDFVHKGDPLVILDSTSIEYEIKAKELSLKEAKLQAKNNITTSTLALENGSNDDILAKKAALELAQTNYDSAMYKYAMAVGNYNGNKNSTIVNAKNALRQAEVELSITDSEDFDARSVKGSAVGSAQANLKAAEADAKAEMDSLFLQVAQAEAELNSAKTAYNSAIAASKVTKSELESKAELAKEGTAAEIAELELNKLKADFENYTITAQCDGYISNLSVKVGDTTDNKLLMNILDYDGMKISIDVDEYDIKAFNLGDKVRIFVSSKNEYYDGKVDSIASEATKKNELSYIKVTILFTPDGMISSGLGATVYTVPGDNINKLAVPSSALLYDTASGNRYVLVRSENGEEERNVVVGDTDGEYTAILEGLSEGEIVVLASTEEDYD